MALIEGPLSVHFLQSSRVVRDGAWSRGGLEGMPWGPYRSQGVQGAHGMNIYIYIYKYISLLNAAAYFPQVDIEVNLVLLKE